MPNLTFTAPRPQLDTRPADPAVPDQLDTEATGDANLTPHVNDPAMRRAPPASGIDPDGVGGSHSDLSPLGKDSSAPIDEETRRRQEADAADVRARRHDIPPRQDIEDWQEAQLRNHT